MKWKIITPPIIITTRNASPIGDIPINSPYEIAIGKITIKTEDGTINKRLSKKINKANPITCTTIVVSWGKTAINSLANAFAVPFDSSRIPMEKEEPNSKKFPNQGF